MTIKVLVSDFRKLTTKPGKETAVRSAGSSKKTFVKRQPTMVLNNDTVAHAVHMERALSNLEKNIDFRRHISSKKEHIRAQAKTRLSARLRERGVVHGGSKKRAKN